MAPRLERWRRDAHALLAALVPAALAVMGTTEPGFATTLRDQILHRVTAAGAFAGIDDGAARPALGRHAANVERMAGHIQADAGPRRGGGWRRGAVAIAIQILITGIAIAMPLPVQFHVNEQALVIAAHADGASAAATLRFPPLDGSTLFADEGTPPEIDDRRGLDGPVDRVSIGAPATLASALGGVRRARPVPEHSGKPTGHEGHHRATSKHRLGEPACQGIKSDVVHVGPQDCHA